MQSHHVTTSKSIAYEKRKTRREIAEAKRERDTEIPPTPSPWAFQAEAHPPRVTPLVIAARKNRASNLPAVLEGDPGAVARVIERWKAVEAESGIPKHRPAMSMAAWNALGADGWVLDDETGRIVGRVDVGWFVERGRRAAARLT